MITENDNGRNVINVVQPRRDIGIETMTIKENGLANAFEKPLRHVKRVYIYRKT